MKDCCIVFLRKVYFFVNFVSAVEKIAIATTPELKQFWINYERMRDFLKSVLTTIVLRYTQKQ